MSSIFERLSQQGTVASKQRDAEERLSRLKNEERRQKETAALTPTKNDRKLRAMHRLPEPHDRIKKNVVRSLKQRDELYARLAKQDTISSAAHHDKASQENNSVGGFYPPKMSPIRTRRELSETFNRLYKQDTASTKAHHHKPKEASISPKKKVAPTPPPSLLTRRLDYKASDPFIPLEMDVYIRTIEEKKSGKPYNNLELAQNEIRKQINLYAMSKISAKALAFDIINTLFHRDFTPGRHWKISSITLEKLDARLDETLMKHGEEKGGNIDLFVGMKEAVCDHKDVHRAAKASAKVIISSEGVYVDEYSFYNLNDGSSQVKGKEVESKKVALAAKNQEKAAVTRVDEERGAIKKSDKAGAAAAEAEARKLAMEEAEAAEKAEEEEAAAKKAKEVAAAEARKLAIEEAEAAKKAEEEENAAKKAKEIAAAEARRLAIEEVKAAKKAEEEETAAKKAKEIAAAEDRKLAIEGAEAAKKAEEEKAAVTKSQETAAAISVVASVATAENEQVQEEVKAVEKYEDADVGTKVEMQ